MLTDGRTDRRSDGRTDGRTDGRKIGRLYRTLLQAGAIKMTKKKKGGIKYVMYMQKQCLTKYCKSISCKRISAKDDLIKLSMCVKFHENIPWG